jgi:hypothetical protein
MADDPEPNPTSILPHPTADAVTLMEIVTAYNILGTEGR